MSKINTDRIGTRDGTLDIDVKSIMVRSDAMENLGDYEQGIELAHTHEFIVKGDSWYTAKTGQVPYVLTGVWEYDKERLEIYGAWDHSSLKNRNKEGSHSAGAIAYDHGSDFPDKSLGKELQTLKNNSSDYQIVDSFEQGATITERNQALQVEADGRLYRWAGDLPKTVAAGSSPETTGGAQVGAWLEVSDLTLRQELANPDMGAAMVGRGVVAVDSIADLLALPAGQRRADLRYLVKGYHAGSNDGGGIFYWDSARELDNDQGLVIQGFVRDISSGAVTLSDFGVRIGSQVYQLAPIVNACEAAKVNLYQSGTTEATPILFDDTFVVQEIEFGSHNGLHLKYVGPDIQDAPVITLGTGLETHGPARFASTQPWLVGEVIQFSSGGFGDVLFTAGGYVYFYWISDDASFPEAGVTATGVTSGAVQAVADIRERKYATNYSGRLVNLYLTTELDLNEEWAMPLSHKRATGILIHGARSGRNFGGTKQIVVQGFWQGIVVCNTWILRMEGFTQTDRCAYGFLLCDESNFVNIEGIIMGMAGTGYDSIRRYAYRFCYSYSVNCELIDMETPLRNVAGQVCAMNGFTCQGGDIEGAVYTVAVFVEGSPALAFVGDAETLQNKIYYSRGINITGLRLWNSFGLSVGGHVDGLSCEDWASCHRTPTLDVPSAMVHLGHAVKCKNIRLKNMVSNGIDFAEEFMKGHVLSENVEFSADCYKYLTFSTTLYKPAAVSHRIITELMGSDARSIELLGLSVSNIEGQVAGMGVDINNYELTKGDYPTLPELTNSTTAPTLGAHFIDSFPGTKFMKTRGIRLRLKNLRTDMDNTYHVSLQYRMLAI